MSGNVIFYGSFPKEGKSPFGGGEIGNMRTVRMLENHGFSVVKIRKKKSPSSAGFCFKLFSYPFRLIDGWCKTIACLASSSRKSLFHISGFAGSTIFNEYVLVHLARLFGYSVVYELRGGGAIEFYDSGSAFYRNTFRSIVSHSSWIFSQGKENIPFIESLTSTPVFHYPNFVESDFAPDSLPSKPADWVNLLFYGRIEEAKHVDLIVEATAELQTKLQNVHLTIIGNGQKEYVDSIRHMMETMLQPNSYEYLPGCVHEELKPFLTNAHFYLFPSTQKYEGQSNAVTESMSYGIIPIASPQGFNRSTIGDGFLIIDNLEAKAYAQKVYEIVSAGKMSDYSEYVFRHYQNNFSEDLVVTQTIAEYQKIFSTLTQNP